MLTVYSQYTRVPPDPDWEQKIKQKQRALWQRKFDPNAIAPKVPEAPPVPTTSDFEMGNYELYDQIKKRPEEVKSLGDMESLATRFGGDIGEVKHLPTGNRVLILWHSGTLELYRLLKNEKHYYRLSEKVPVNAPIEGHTVLNAIKTAIGNAKDYLSSFT